MIDMETGTLVSTISTFRKTTRGPNGKNRMLRDERKCRRGESSAGREGICYVHEGEDEDSGSTSPRLGQDMQKIIVSIDSHIQEVVGGETV